MAISPGDRAAMLSVQQLRTFCAVYRYQGYAAAEPHLGLAVPTMWEQIKAMEQVYRSPLFERQGRRIVPTPLADMLYRQILPILAGLESSFEIVEEHAGYIPDRVSIVTGVRMMLEELGPPLREFQKAYPDVRLRLMHADNITAQQRVLDEQADLALMIEPPPALTRPGLTYKRLYSLDAMAVLPRRHRQAKAARIALADIIDDPLIVGNAQTVGRQLLEHALYRQGLLPRLRIAAETDNSAFTVACVRAGLGVGIIAGTLKGGLLKQVVARSLRDELGRTFVVAAIREGREPTWLLRSLLETLEGASGQ
ncbi:LysR family transcriptional regulator [Maioricimonas sp. JC845]|uniref:LysR family transcriptional regulator n=1 Tax=Maioricimonas sp. JC845 TaxID=3232138 RepID=UPI003458A872